MTRRMQSRRWTSWLPDALVSALIAAYSIRIGSVWHALPARLASHFGVSGEANSFMARDSFFLSMAFVCGLTISVPAIVRFMLHRMPDKLINLPNRDYWLAPERRDTTIERLHGFLSWLAVVIALLFAWTLELIVRANLSGTGVDMRAFGIGFAAFVASIIYLLARLSRGFQAPAETN